MGMKFLMIMAGFLIPLVAQAQSPVSLLERKIAQTPWFSGRFTQTSYNQLKDESVVLTGEVMWMRPGVARFEYKTPDPLLLVVGEEKIWIYDPLLENVTVEPKSEVERVDALSFLFGKSRLRGSYIQIKKPQEKTNFTQKDWLYFRPIKPIEGLSELHIQPGGTVIKSFLIFDGHGNWRRFDFTAKKGAKKPVPKDFIFEIPLGMEVIDKLSVGH